MFWADGLLEPRLRLPHTITNGSASMCGYRDIHFNTHWNSRLWLPMHLLPPPTPLFKTYSNYPVKERCPLPPIVRVLQCSSPATCSPQRPAPGERRDERQRLKCLGLRGASVVGRPSPPLKQPLGVDHAARLEHSQSR